MQINRRLAADDVALTVCFSALYVVLAFLPMFQVIGVFGKTITAATIMAPIIGIILGPYLGGLSAFLGGALGLFLSPYFSLPSSVAGVFAALCAGLLYANRRIVCALIYLSLLLLFGFYAPIGPVWVYPPMMWFQTLGFLILISPLQSMAIKSFNSGNTSRVLFSFFITSLTSTLAGQIAGSLAFELTSWPILIPDVNAWRATWQFLTFLYPLERIILALFSGLIGASLYAALKSANLIRILSRTNHEEKHS